MATVTRPTGLQISLPDTFEISAVRPRRGRASRRPQRPTGPVPLTGSQADLTSEELATALADQLELVDRLLLNPTEAPTLISGRRARGAPAVPSHNPIEFDLKIAAGESAVLLVEQDGVLSWVFGSEAVDPVPSRRRRGEPTVKHVHFEVDAHASSSKQRRTSRRGFVSDLILRPIKAYVFKFVAGVVAGQVVKRLEADVRTGPVLIRSADPVEWRKGSSLKRLSLPKNETCRVLLLLHGTFSSTVGGFGALGATPHGREFLDSAIDRYDCVLGYDHRTLSEDPLENAEGLLAMLQSLPCDGPVVVDAIVHSRGTLVVRSLVEYLLARQAAGSLRFRKVAMVGGPNAGTGLALPDNWHTFVDLYTNVAIAGTRAAAFFAPPAATVALILKEVLEGVAMFVKALAAAAVDTDQVPGLAAMVPEGRFVTQLNRTQADQPLPDTIDFYAIRSDFQVDGRTADGDDSLPVRLKKALADHLVDQIIGASNDLVVDVASMIHVDPHVEGYLRDTFDFGPNGRVFHTNYFLQAQTVASLARWFGLMQAPEAAAAIVRDLPAVVSDDFTRLDASMDIDEIRTLLSASASEYAVVRRFDTGRSRVFHYAFRPDELLDAVAGVTETMALNDTGLLHESESSEDVHLSEVGGLSRRSAEFPWSRRMVVKEDDHVVGVVPNAGDSPPAASSLRSALRSSARPRRRSRGGRPAAASAARPAAAPGRAGPVSQYFRAEMPARMSTGRRGFLTVEVSGTELAVRTAPSRAAGTARVDPKKQLTVTVIPKANFRVVGEQRVSFMPLTAAQQEIYTFELEAGSVGPGQVWVVAQQGPQALVTLDLNVAIVAGTAAAGVEQATATAAVTMPPKIKPRHHLSIYETQNDGLVSYMFDFRSESLNLTEFGVTNGIRNREGYVEAMYREIENRWVASAEDVDNFDAELKAYGADLFHELVPRNIRKALWDNRDRIDSIEVISTEPFVPWEVVHLTPPDQKELSSGKDYFLGAMGMVRWLHGAGAAPTELTLRSDKFLAVVPDYPAGSDWELAETAEERDFLENELNARIVDPQPMPLQQIIQQPDSFDVLHFAGHGFAELDDITNSQIMLGGRVQDGQWVPNYFSANRVESYANLLQADGNRPMVVLNACQVGRGGYKLTSIGGFSKAFICKKAGAFISSMWSVGDAPARTFTETLYKELLRGRTLARAVHTARMAARAAGDASWLAYVVYGNPYLKVRKKLAKVRARAGAAAEA